MAEPPPTIAAAPPRLNRSAVHASSGTGETTRNWMLWLTAGILVVCSLLIVIFVALALWLHPEGGNENSSNTNGNVNTYRSPAPVNSTGNANTNSGRHGQLGVQVQQTGVGNLFSKSGGLIVVEVKPGSAAERAGILPKDEIMWVNSRNMTVNDPEKFANLISAMPPGTRVNLGILRRNSEIEIQVTLDDANTGRR